MIAGYLASWSLFRMGAPLSTLVSASAPSPRCSVGYVRSYCSPILARWAPSMNTFRNLPTQMTTSGCHVYLAWQVSDLQYNILDMAYVELGTI